MFTVKRIAIVSSFFPPSDMVAAGYSYYLAKELSSIGVKVKVFTTWSNESCGAKRMDNLDVSCIPQKKVLNRFYNVKRKHYKTILNEIKEFDPDCVCTNDYYRKLSLFAAKAARELNIPCISINHLSKPLTAKNRIMNYFINRYEVRALHLNKKYRVVFAGTSAAKCEHLRKMNAVSRYEIPDGIDTDIDPLPSARRSLGIDKSDIVFAINLDENFVDIQKAISAFKEIGKYTGPKSALIILGEKPKKYKEDTSGVIFTGKVTKEDELAIKYTSDIYISFITSSSSYKDIMEVGLLKTSVICTLLEDDIKFSLIRDKENGILIKDDASLRVAAMQKLRLHTKLRGELSNKLKDEIEQKYNWGQSALALIDAVWELNGGRRRG